MLRIPTARLLLPTPTARQLLLRLGFLKSAKRLSAFRQGQNPVSRCLPAPRQCMSRLSAFSFRAQAGPGWILGLVLVGILGGGGYWWYENYFKDPETTPEDGMVANADNGGSGTASNTPANDNGGEGNNASSAAAMPGGDNDSDNEATSSGIGTSEDITRRSNAGSREAEMASFPSPAEDESMDMNTMPGSISSDALERRDEAHRNNSFSSEDTSALAGSKVGEDDAYAGEMPGYGEDESVDFNETDIPGGRRDHTIARGGTTAVPAGRDQGYYWTLLRNALNRKASDEFDLEKAWLLLTMYFNPEYDPEEYTSKIDDLSRELKSALVSEERQMVDGVEQVRRVLRGKDERTRVEAIIQFMLHGMVSNEVETARGTGVDYRRVHGGFEIQEYHPGIRGAGIPLYRQHFLADQVLANDLKAGNSASSTALNILTLILLRRLSMEVLAADDIESGMEVRVSIPMFGVRLPDRTILRYDHRGWGNMIPDVENILQAEPSRAIPPELGRLKTGTRTEIKSADAYERNVEFLRNGNHYNGSDYWRRYNLSSTDLVEGIYLRTLSDLHMFATLGYEIARVQIAAGNVEGVDQPTKTRHFNQAQKILEEWVLDRDDGRGFRFDNSRRSAPREEFRMPRGDLSLRDAYILYAQLMLDRSDYSGIKRMIREANVFTASPDRATQLFGAIQKVNGQLDQATATLERALMASAVGNEGTRANRDSPRDLALSG